jgi:preprotein translocase subunit SecF
MKLNFVRTRIYFFIVSAFLVISSLVLLAIPPAFVPGIDFSSGTTMLISSDAQFDQSQMRTLFGELGHPEARIQTSITKNGFEYLIRTKELKVPQDAFTYSSPISSVSNALSQPTEVKTLGNVIAASVSTSNGSVFLREIVAKKSSKGLLGSYCSDDLGEVVFEVKNGTKLDVVKEPSIACGGESSDQVFSILYNDLVVYMLAADGPEYTAFKSQLTERNISTNLGERSTIELAIYEKFGSFDLLEFSSVSPIVSQVAVRNASISVIIATFFIMGYVAYAFSEMPKPFRYALAAIVALVHDVIIVLGVFSLLGKVLDFEINLMVITGLLTILGFSVHDSIVVFDRIRENISRNPLNKLSDNVNVALVETLARSLNTSVTLLLTVLTLLFLGGPTIREFLVTMLVGIIVGTYSSIAIAAQVLVAWEEGDFGRIRNKLFNRKQA